MSQYMKQYLNKHVLIVLSEGEIMEGKLIGYDKHLNLTLEKFILGRDEKTGEQPTSGHVMTVVRGDLIVFLGELDAEKIDKLDEINRENTKYNELVNNINNPQYKFYKSTKNATDEREIRTWMKVHQLRKNQPIKRRLEENDSSVTAAAKKAKT